MRNTEVELERDAIEVWRPDDLPELELQRGANVSRNVPRHWHEEYQLCLIQSGIGELNYRGNHLTTPAASLFIVHPGEVHANRCYDRFGVAYRTIFVSVELMRRVTEHQEKRQDIPFFPIAVLFDEDVIAHYLKFCLALENSSSRLEREVLLLDLITMLIRRFSETRPTQRPVRFERQAVKRAYQYLLEHYAENIPLQNLALIANLSPFHFNRAFAEEFGMPPHAFQTQVRILRAKSLLRQGLSISDVALSNGFADQSHFTRHFKNLTGITPGQYLQSSKNVQDSRR